jgi:uncharacterized protein YozE (UPF0346 family)
MFQKRLLCLAVLILAFAAISTSAKPSKKRQPENSEEAEELADEVYAYAARLTNQEEDDLAKYQAATNDRRANRKRQPEDSEEAEELADEVYGYLDRRNKLNARLSEADIEKYEAASKRGAKRQPEDSEEAEELADEVYAYVDRRNKLRNAKRQPEDSEEAEELADEVYAYVDRRNKLNARLTNQEESDLEKYEALSKKRGAKRQPEDSEEAEELADEVYAYVDRRNKLAARRGH